MRQTGATKMQSDEFLPAGHTLVPIRAIKADPRAWPRHALDEERVASFLTLYTEAGLDALPPVEVVGPAADGTFLLADGWHRLAALAKTDATQVPAVQVDPADRDHTEVAFERGCLTAATTSKPLSRAERNAAACRLIIERPDRADREVARIVGISPQTVGRLRRRSNGTAAATESEQGAGDLYLARVTADELARRLVVGLQRLWDERGLGEWILNRDHTGNRLAVALRERFGANAYEWANRLAAWTRAAVLELEKDKTG
jgi:ParB-like chromosome segregation protein Spo0J